jgi:hypothetical protein
MMNHICNATIYNNEGGTVQLEVTLAERGTQNPQYERLYTIHADSLGEAVRKCREWFTAKGIDCPDIFYCNKPEESFWIDAVIHRAGSHVALMGLDG